MTSMTPFARLDSSGEDARIGSLLDQRYRILRRFGRGGSGVVYEARHEEMGRLAAVKILRSDLFLGADALERFRREARAAGRLRHPNVVIVHDFGRTADGELYLVMEACEGGNLADRLRSGEPLSLAEVAATFVPVCAAVGAAHRAGVVHRDLKPANVLYAGGVPKVADFGLARMLEEDDQGLTGGHAIGSPAYMSPEQCAGDSADARSDVYSLGVMLFEALTGRLPFAGPTLQATLTAHLLAELPDPLELRPELPVPVAELLRRALAREPTERYASAEELGMALAAALEAKVPARREVGVGRPTSARVRKTSEQLPVVPIGRKREMAQLFQALQAARSGRGGLVTIAGEPGLGKSTLLQAFLGQLGASLPDVMVALGRCSEHFGESEAYLPFFDALGGLLAGATRETVERTVRAAAPTWAAQLPVLAPSPGNAAPEGAARLRDRMPRELGDALGRLAAERPLVIALEDLHWADSASIDLLSYLVPRLETLPVLVVGTYRPEDVERTGHPLRALLRRLRLGSNREIVPSSLGEPEIAELVARELGGTPPAELVTLVARITEGNPLFVVNAARHLLEAGAVVRAGERMVLLSPATELEESLPHGLMGLLEERIGRLEESERVLLQAASVLGDTFEALVVAKLLGEDELAVEERLDAVARRHRLIEPVGELDYPCGLVSTRLRFVHALYQNALYSSLLARRRTVWHGVAAATLRALYGRHTEPVAVALAVHHERARELPAAITAYVEAAELIGRGNPRDARPLLARALALAERLDGADSAVRRADLLVRLARHDAETAELIGDVALYDRAQELATAALAIAPGSAEARTTLGLVHLERGDNLAAFEDFTRVLAAEPRHGAAWDGLAYLFKNTGLWEEALVACERAGACDARFAHSIRKLSVLLFQQRIEEAVAEAEALVARRPRFSHYAYWRGIAAFYAGDQAGCRAWVERGYGFDPEDQIGQGVLAFVEAWEGNASRARALVRSAEQGALADGTFTYWIANVYVVLGEVEPALSWMRRAVDLGYWNAPWMARDLAIARLRTTPGFAALLSDVEARHRAFAEAVRPRWAALLAAQS
jgi:tetratricopeptide (TPR) repeat protein